MVLTFNIMSCVILIRYVGTTVPREGAARYNVASLALFVLQRARCPAPSAHVLLWLYHHLQKVYQQERAQLWVWLYHGMVVCDGVLLPALWARAGLLFNYRTGDQWQHWCV